MRLSTLSYASLSGAGLGAACLIGVSLAVAVALATPAEALYGCFCSKQNEQDRFCGEVLKFSEDIIVIKPRAKVSLTLKPVEVAECRNPCPAGQYWQDDRCVASGPVPSPVVAPPAKPAPPAVPEAPPATTPSTVEPDASPKPDEHFGIAGSNTIGEHLMPALIEAFGHAQGFVPDGRTCNDTTFRLRREAWTLSIACSAHGSDTGIPALAEGRADIAMLSRPISAKEQATMRRAGYPAMDTVSHETVLALDGILILVAPRNPVRSLSVDQIAKVFAGEIADWGQIGGIPGKINLYVRDERSGTRDTFEAMVMRPHRKTISRTAKKFESSTGLSDSVAADPRGIGFVGFAYQGKARAVPIAQPCGLVHPASTLAIKAEDYPLSRRLYLYTAKEHSAYSSELIQYALSSAAQPVVAGAGYINQAIASWGNADTKERVSRYIEAPLQEPGLDQDATWLAELRASAENAERLSISFRFRSNSSKLDTKAWQDVLRLAEHMQSNAGDKKVLLMGFADSQGSFDHNLRLAQERANEVRTSLLNSGAGLSPDSIEAHGYSELMPVACNADEIGRTKNRRVEVWLTER